MERASELALARWEAERHRRRRYTGGGLALVALALVASLLFANETSAGKFLDRWPHLLDFVGDLEPESWADVPRALLDLPSPNDDGSLKHDYPEGRVALPGGLYLPEYAYLMIVTLNVALVSTLLGGAAGFLACFVAARNLVGRAWLRGSVRRVLEVLRAFPEIVIAGFFVAVLSLGPIPAIAAIALHTAGALGKLFYEIVENADLRAAEGLEAVGARWTERVRFGVVPQVLPDFASHALLRLEINVRASTIIGAVGGGGIGEALRLSIGRGHEAKTLAILALLFATVVAVDRISAALRDALAGRGGPASPAAPDIDPPGAPGQPGTSAGGPREPLSA